MPPRVARFERTKEATHQRGDLGVANGVRIFRSNGAGRKTRREPSCVDFVRRSVWCGAAVDLRVGHQRAPPIPCARRNLDFGPRRGTLRRSPRDVFVAKKTEGALTTWWFERAALYRLENLARVCRVESHRSRALCGFQRRRYEIFRKTRPASGVHRCLPCTQLSRDSRRTSSKV